ncbi:hypothetical protein M9H77_36462 [Catharanthus roseus]|uniref:Uncharacterized protein n=1 Tax=Catharanthus roseus TaxID=4058 RepID=A0ACB9ZU20_CATRO|nr:hypothetical protein M9H77_36462 [Catharanthus roseus]
MIFLDPTTDSRFHPTVDGRVMDKKGLEQSYLLWMVGGGLPSPGGLTTNCKEPSKYSYVGRHWEHTSNEDFLRGKTKKSPSNYTGEESKRQEVEYIDIKTVEGFKCSNHVYHEGCNYDAHNQGENAYCGINLSCTNFIPRRQDGVGNFFPVLDPLSMHLIIAMRKIELRRRKGVGFNTRRELKGALSIKFGVGQFESLEWSQAMGNSKGKKEMYISSQGIKRGGFMKPSLLEKSSMVNKLLAARIEIDESVKMHVEREMSKEYFVDSMSDLSFEKEEIIELERKDRVKKQRD